MRPTVVAVRPSLALGTAALVPFAACGGVADGEREKADPRADPALGAHAELSGGGVAPDEPASPGTRLPSAPGEGSPLASSEPPAPRPPASTEPPAPAREPEAGPSCWTSEGRRPSGARWLAADGCETCECDGSHVVCSSLPCPIPCNSDGCWEPKYFGDPCCTERLTCGLSIRWHDVGCVELDQPGLPTAECPTVEWEDLELPGCCRPSRTCGAWGAGMGLGCVDPAIFEAPPGGPC